MVSFRELREDLKERVDKLEYLMKIMVSVHRTGKYLENEVLCSPIYGKGVHSKSQSCTNNLNPEINGSRELSRT